MKKNKQASDENVIINMSEAKALIEIHKSQSKIKQISMETAKNIIDNAEKIITNYAILRIIIRRALVLGDTKSSTVQEERLKLELQSLLIERHQKNLLLIKFLTKGNKNGKK